jgi:hypothetical protein
MHRAFWLDRRLGDNLSDQRDDRPAQIRVANTSNATASATPSDVVRKLV